MLVCKKLNDNAILPTVAHPGEDLAFDLYASEDIRLHPGEATIVHTGITARYFDEQNELTYQPRYGLLFRDRSSMASKGITVSGGVIDSGYDGEFMVVLTNHTKFIYKINTGEKIVQMIPLASYTAGEIKWVEELPLSNRGDKGFGSSGA